jgi:hypothetical protein
MSSFTGRIDIYQLCAIRPKPLRKIKVELLMLTEKSRSRDFWPVKVSYSESDAS